MTPLRAFVIFPLLAASVIAFPALAGAPPPRVSIQTLSELSVPGSAYDTSADADGDVARAFAQARIQNKRVLIDLGGNWCGDCRVLAAIMELPEVQQFLEAHYVVVSVDVGRFNRNLQIPARFGITQRLEGVPAVLIASPDGRLVNVGHIEALEDARRMTPQDIVNWLASWA